MKDSMPSRDVISNGLLALPGGSYLLDAAQAWRLSPAVVLFIFLFPFMIASFGLFTALLGKESYKWFTGEDGLAENLQVALYLAALVLAILISIRLWRSGERFIAILYAALCLALFFMVGEEISWGQRIFGWETSESLAAINKQDETTVHNIITVATAFKWAQLMVGAYGTILPLALLHWRIPKRFQKLASALIPHYSLILYFALLFLWRIYRNLFEAPQEYSFAISEFNEVLELILAVGLFAFMIFQLRQEKAKRNQNGESNSTPEGRFS